jgi:hypothetical protein
MHCRFLRPHILGMRSTLQTMLAAGYIVVLFPCQDSSRFESSLRLQVIWASYADDLAITLSTPWDQGTAGQL